MQTPEINEIKNVKDNHIDLFNELYNDCATAGVIDVNLYEEFDVKRGLRDANGKGVLTGLTEISDILATELVGGKKLPTDGKLYYQGYDVTELLKEENLG